VSWRGVDAELADTGLDFPTLGIVAWEWIESHCVIPDGDQMGEPFTLTDEMVKLLVHFYRLDPDSQSMKWDGPRFRYPRGAQLVRPQKWGKSPFSAAVILFEACGPALPDGWDADGRPVGRPWPSPHVQITAVSESQTQNVYRALLPMVKFGPLDELLPDTGLMRVNLPGGGLIEPVTASAMSRLGQRVTFVLADEALALDTPLPTPTGWTTMGAVRVGDELMGADGLPVTVTKATPVQHGRTCYRVTFADHTSVVTSDGHLWQTRVANSAALPRVRSTGEMVADGRRFRVPPPMPYKLPDAELPVDPYLLGLWLGDGSTGGCNVAKSDADIAEFEVELRRRGIPTHRLETKPDKAVRLSFTTVGGWQCSESPPQARALRRLPCYRDKHIPTEYLRASYDQRVDLLRGLMDTDGHVDGRTGNCVFTGTRRLCSDVVALLRTLGQTARMVWHLDDRAREGGGGKVHFTPRHGLNPCLLRRKADRIRPRSPDTWVSIISIEPVESVPVRCIEVDANDHLFLCGEGGHVTHNTHGWTERNAGKRLADNQRRNLSGMGGRFLETTNAWSITDDSVAQDTCENPVGVFVDYPAPIGGSVRNKAERRKAMRHAYGDSVRNGPTWKGWVDLDRIDVEIEALSKRDPAQAERFFLNRVHAGEDVAFNLEAWRDATRADVVVPDGTLIAIGVDGARWEDALAVVATTVDGFHMWPLIITEKPPGAGPDYEHDLDLVDATVEAAFERWEVGLLYADPQKIEHLTDRWTGRWGKDRVADFVTNLRSRRLGDAVGCFVSAVAAGDVSHDGDTVMARHIANARRKVLPALDDDGRNLFTLTKDRPHSPNKIDGAMAGVIAAEARRDCISKGMLNARRPSWFVGI
jgi:hypothetical protein